MNTKKIWPTVPIILLPYFALLTLATVFLSTDVAFFRWIMKSVFRGNALCLIAALLIYCLLVTALSVVYFIVSIYKKWDPLSLAKIFMTVKLLQIPAYVLIFVLGVLLSFAIFTIPFTAALFFLDCLSLFLSRLGVASAVINAFGQGIFKPKEIVWVLIAQFVFCLDVIASIILYIKLKNLKTDTQKQ